MSDGKWRITIELDHYESGEAVWLATAARDDSPMHDATGPTVETALAELALALCEALEEQ